LQIGFEVYAAFCPDLGLGRFTQGMLVVWHLASSNVAITKKKPHEIWDCALEIGKIINDLHQKLERLARLFHDIQRHT
jgi:hypothetical protein